MPEECGLVEFLWKGRFSFWQIWLTQASTFANLQASALNIGVPTAPNLPEFIAHTWAVFDPSRSCTPCEPPTQLTNKLVWERWIE